MRNLFWYLCLFGFCVAALNWGWFRSVDRFFYDLGIQAAPPALDERLLIIGIDEQTLAQQGRWPWERSLQARLLGELVAARPLGLFVDVVYSGNSNPMDDGALATALSGDVTVAMPVIIDTVAVNGPLIEVLPFPELIPHADVLGHVHLELDDDSISRSTFLFQGIGDAHWPHAMLGLARELGIARVSQTFDCAGDGSFSMRNQVCGEVMLPFAGPPGTIPEISAQAVFDGRVPADLLRDRVLLVGLTAAGVADWVTSPVSGESRPISGVEYNANLLNAIVQDRLITPVPLNVVWALTLFLVLPAVFVLPRTSPKAMVGLTVFNALLPLALSVIAFAWFSRYLPLATASITALLAYPLWSWRRHEVAWRFLDREITRMQTERERFSPIEAALIGSRRLSPGKIEALFGARVQPVGSIEPRAFESARICWDDENGGHRLLRDAPFTPSEVALAQHLLHEPVPELVEPVPGESLAVKIRKLERNTRAVQFAREISLQSLERMSSGVCVVSALGDVLFANSAFYSLLDLPVTDQSQAAEYDDLFERMQAVTPPLGKSWRDIWRGVVFEQEPLGFETALAHGIQVFVYCAPLSEGALSQGQRGSWVLTLTDTTDVRVAQKRREEALAFLSHDLRSPIVSIITLARQGDNSELLQQIVDYAQRSLSVSEQFLQLSRLEARTQFETYGLDLLSVVENARDQVYAQARERDVLILGPVIDDEPEDGVWVEGNGELLERVFVNLLTNAIKYGGDGKQIEVRMEVVPKWVRVSVKDQGIGIPAEDLEQIFEPYYRSSDPDLAQKRGSGLGLRFVKTVAERHGGRVEVTSAPGAGSTFVVELPREEISADDPSAGELVNGSVERR